MSLARKGGAWTEAENEDVRRKARQKNKRKRKVNKTMMSNEDHGQSQGKESVSWDGA